MWSEKIEQAGNHREQQGELVNEPILAYMWLLTTCWQRYNAARAKRGSARESRELVEQAAGEHCSSCWAVRGGRKRSSPSWV